jgi:NAD(P)-dependent dehydrogenase (short-subunit alcohol dehydrogenase family)
MTSDGSPARVAVVTGAASGIGLGIARRFAADGRRVALLDRDGEAAEKAAVELRSSGDGAAAPEAVAVEVDVSDWSAVAAAFDRVRSELGPIGILVTSAGIDAFTPVLEITPELWNRILAVNLTGTFACIQAALPDMVDAGWGRIVTIASSSAQSGTPLMAHYASSKGGVISLTKALAREVAQHGITVNTVPPSVIDTPMARGAESRGLVDLERMSGLVPVGRTGTPDDIAAACAYLCSDEASYVTGQVVGVNGGMYI